MHPIACALTFAAFSAGNNMAARMAMMAITTRSSISVKPGRRADRDLIRSKPASRLQLGEFVSINELLLEPEILLGPGDGIGHGVLAGDKDGRRQIRAPDRRRTEARTGCQMKCREIRNPGQDHIRT